jgi:hypothetical protein
MWQYALNAGWVLLPLIPATLIYKIFPKTEVSLSGPFKGLQLNATGAFGVYLTVFLASTPFLWMQNSNLLSLLTPTWVVSGLVELQDEQGHPVILDANDRQKLNLSLNPNPLRLVGGNRFEAKVPKIDGHIPTLQISYPGYGDVFADVENPALGANVKKDEFNRTVAITSKLVIRKRCEGTLCAGH